MIEFALKTTDHEKYNLSIKHDYDTWRIAETPLKSAYLFKILYNLRPAQLYSGEMFFDLD
jgi:hypothetical protein